jgi:DNA-binding transcriptional LysR family regulator
VLVLVDEGLDLAIRTGELEDSNLIAKPLLTSYWLVCCSPLYTDKHGNPKDIDDLTNHNCLAYTGQAKGAYDWRFDRNNEHHSIRISGGFSTNNAQALRKAALAGLGIIYVPKCCVYEDLEKGNLVTILEGYKPRSLGVYAMYSYTR